MPARARFVTGGAGFAGRHLLPLLPDAVAPSRAELDLLDAGAVRSAVREAAPEVVFHLAALASVRPVMGGAGGDAHSRTSP